MNRPDTKSWKQRTSKWTSNTWSFLPRILFPHFEFHSVVFLPQHPGYDPTEPCKHIQNHPRPRCYFPENYWSFFLFAYNQLSAQTPSYQQFWWNWIYSETVLGWSPSLHLAIQKHNTKREKKVISDNTIGSIQFWIFLKKVYEKWNITK